jgi:hypothetical protein
MKQKDLALIIVVAVISAILSVILSNLLIVPKKALSSTAEVVEAISPDFSQPDPKYFNSNSNDPTQLIKIGSNNNSQPFNVVQPN